MGPNALNPVQNALNTVQNALNPFSWSKSHKKMHHSPGPNAPSHQKCASYPGKSALPLKGAFASGKGASSLKGTIWPWGPEKSTLGYGP